MFGLHNRPLAALLVLGLTAAGCASSSKPASSPAQESSQPKAAAQPGQPSPEARSLDERCAQALVDVAARVRAGVDAALARSGSREEAALELMQLLPGSVRAQKMIADVLVEQHVKPEELQQYLATNAAGRQKFEQDLEAISQAASSAGRLPSLAEREGGCAEIVERVLTVKETDEIAARGAGPLLAPCRGKLPERQLLCALSAANHAGFEACVRGEQDPAPPAGAAPPPSALPAPWQTKLDQVGRGKPALIVYCAYWAQACHTLTKDVLTKPELLSALERDFVAVYVDVTNTDAPESKRALARFDVKGVPTILISDRKGKIVSRTLEVVPIDQLLELLSKQR